MILSQRRQRVVAPRCSLPLIPGSDAFAIEGLRPVPRGVETIPHLRSERAPAAAAVSRAADLHLAELHLATVHFAALHSAASHFATLHLATRHGVEIETTALSRTTSCPKVVARAQAGRHMDHSPTSGQVSTTTFSVSKATLAVLEATSRKTRASNAPISKALASGRGVERRGGWTFTLGTCRTDFPRFACLPRSRCTVTSVRGSLGSCQGEKPSWLSFIFWRAGAPTRAIFWRAGAPTRAIFWRAGAPTRAIFWRAGAPARAGSTSFQDQSRVFVPKLGRAPYIGAGGARPMLDTGGLGGASPGLQYARRRQRPFIATVRERLERHEPMSPPREELGARWI
jgi:hypothetical protein